jgi:alcohol dehydrogenase class IV
MRTTWTFHTPGKLVFGRGAVQHLGEIVRQLKVARALLITDKPLVHAGVAQTVCEPLAAAAVAVDVFDGGEPEPPIKAANAVIEAARAMRAEILIGVGGGSNMDIAKAAAVVFAHGGTVKDFAGDSIVPGPIFPLVLIPTTAGTGSEVTAASVLSDPEQGTKFSILSNHLRPHAALVDPLLTVSCPPRVTAGSGIDALTHAIEAYTAIDNESFPVPEGQRTVYQGRHAVVDLFAERAIQLIGCHLRRAVGDGRDIEAREGMSMAATFAGLAFSNSGVAAVHALEYALNQVAHIPHGTGCGLLLPYVMQFNLPVCRQRMARIAELLGDDMAGLDAASAAERAIGAVERLKADIGIPARMSEVGVRTEHLAGMAEKAFAVKRVLRVNPRSVTQNDLEAILQSAL